MPSLPRRALFAAAAALALPWLRRAAAQPATRIALTHVNDFHSRHEGLQAGGANCRTDAPCLGGSPRLAAAVSAARDAAVAEGRSVFSLDAGDQFMGSLFYTVHRGLTEAAVQRAWGCEAMALGNHEFDHGPETLARYAAAVPFPLLAANLDTRDEPLLAGRIAPYTVLARGGARLGVVGLITETTPGISSPGPRLRFTDAAEAADRASFAIRRDGPATIILLSHCGLAEDQRLAAAVPGVDVIVGGHSHTLLANGLAGAAGPAPVLVEGRDRTVRIVQAGAFGRYAGRLDLDLAPDGRVASHAGTVREITPEIAPDPAVERIVAEFAAPLGEVRRRPVAQLGVALDTDCRDKECALGNLIADALLAAVPRAQVALQNGGGLRAGLAAGAVTYGDVLTVLPFSNTVATLGLRGHDLRAALENGVSQPGAGRWPQVGGLRFTWNPAAQVGQRITQIEIAEGGRFVPLDPERVYLIATNNFLRNGGDGYTSLRDAALDPYDTGPLLEEVVAGYMAARTPLAPRAEGRIARE